MTKVRWHGKISVNNSSAKMLLLCAKLWHSVLRCGIPTVLLGYITKTIQPVNAQLYCSDAVKLCTDGLLYFFHYTWHSASRHKSHYVHRLQSLDTENDLGPNCIHNK